MNILFMGTPDIAAAALEAILDAGHTVCGVYTRADKPVGRKQVLTAPPVKRTAMAHGIPVFQPGTLRDAAQAENIRALAPELIVVVAYGRILPPEVLAIPQYGCINLHVSLLPRYRGAAPVQWAVINGEKTTGVSIMYLNEGLDTGDILRVSPVEIGENETSGDVGEEIARIVEGQITKKVWNVLEPFYGADNIRISTNVTIDMEKVIRESITYTTPEKIDLNDKSGIISHEKTDTEASGVGGTAGGVVGTEDNSDISQYVANAIGSDDGYYSNIIDRDYLVNQIKEQGELASGAVKDKTVSVSINQAAQDTIDTTRLRELIGNAAGIDAADRTDKISIVAAPFYDPSAGADQPTSILEWKYFPFLVAAAVALILLLILILLLAKRAKKKKALAEGEEDGGVLASLQNEAALENEKQELLNMKNERSRTLRENVRDFADANPEIAAHMIKDWLHGGEGDNGQE